MKEIENTVLAMTEWLDENTDGYLVLITKDSQTMCIVKSKKEKNLLESLVSGIIKEPALKSLLRKALSIAMTLELETKLKKHKNNGTSL